MLYPLPLLCCVLPARPTPAHLTLAQRRRGTTAIDLIALIRGVDEGGAKERRAGRGGGESYDSRLLVDRLPSSEAVTGPRRSPREERMRIR
ncbi:hypothetical protein BHE74_00042352 [Ensete ventricosum]|nr:hypothetical protein GW17_00005501 [Ensete ventricosum]RWW51314.1 hypothetical protein BHE74_00042352 [Ensete ventricosum]